MCNQITVVSPQCKGTMKHLSTACWDKVGRWGGDCSLMPPNNTPVYSVLGLPLLNTFLTFQGLHSIQKSAKRDLRLPFLPTASGEIHNDPLRTTWDLVVWWWGGGQCLYCLVSIGN